MDNVEGTSTRLAEIEIFVPDVEQNTQLVEQVFIMFKGHSSHLEARNETLEP